MSRKDVLIALSKGEIDVQEANRLLADRRNLGRKRANQHIKEARQLTIELGGVDQDVKDYFFALREVQLSQILVAYERLHGSRAREYAEKTIPDWRCGRVKMSGEVAARLFALLPTFMPIAKKYELVQSLWERKCPRSNKTFYVGVDAAEKDVRDCVRDHLSDAVKDYRIPDAIANRFLWLAQDDVELQQRLYNYFLQLNREVVAIACDQRIPILMRQIACGDGASREIQQSVRVANHCVELVFHGKTGGVTTVKPRSIVPSFGTVEQGYGWFIAIAIIIFLLFIMNV